MCHVLVEKAVTSVNAKGTVTPQIKGRLYFEMSKNSFFVDEVNLKMKCEANFDLNFKTKCVLMSGLFSAWFEEWWLVHRARVKVKHLNGETHKSNTRVAILSQAGQPVLMLT